LLGTKSESHPRLLCFSLTHSPPNHFYCHTAPKLTATPSSILLSSIPSYLIMSWEEERCFVPHRMGHWGFTFI
jgi:hypothetical protein